MDARDPDPTVPSPPEKVKNRNVSSQERRDIVLTLPCQSNMAIAKLSVDKDFCVYHSNNLLIFQFMSFSQCVLVSQQHAGAQRRRNFR